MSISSNAVLVELNITIWNATKTDHVATELVTTANNACTDAARVSKNLLPGTQLRKDISDYAAQSRLWHTSRTLPWADRGPRLLPSSAFFDYKTELNQRRDTFYAKVDKFEQAYPSLKALAQHKLGGLFNADDYPDVGDIRGKFSFKTVFSPVPDSGDFRLEIPAMEMEEMRLSYEENFNARLNDAMREPWDRLHKMLSGMSDKLVESTDADKKKRWHGTFLSNAEELCDVLDTLNLTKDRKLSNACAALRSSLRGMSVDTLKDSEHARASLKRNVDSILETFDW
jgi:hypothetical protein